MNQIEITIVVKNGMVQDVFGTEKNILMNIIDLDGQDFDELNEEVDKLRKNQFILC